MKPTTLTILGLAATVATAAFAPLAAHADQKSKNQWRNLGIAGAAVTGYGLLKHNTTATVLGAAGTAYSANRYEQDRHHQSQEQAARDRRARYHRTYRSGAPYGRAYSSHRRHSYHSHR